MKTWVLMAILVLMFGISNWEMLNASSGHTGHGSASEHKNMEHHSMGTSFSHEAIVDGVRAEFQVMSLDEMKMKDPQGNTHHVMVKFFDQSTNERITKVIGKIKVITPSGKDQVATLKDYSGIYAANFTVEEKGKYGIICLFKIHDNKHLVKFWYKPE